MAAETWRLYKRQPGFVLGFHGCDASVGEAVLSGEEWLKPSENRYDWLGSGIYFWEGNPGRAWQFAEDAAGPQRQITKGTVKNPFVVGAVIDLGYCCSLLDSAALAEVKEMHRTLMDVSRLTGIPLPANKLGPDKLVRELDCAVIEYMHYLRRRRGAALYDTVRSPFWEGGELYPGAGFAQKAHIQIAVRNPSCIRGYFRPITA